MDPYSKTGLRLNKATPLFPPGARPAPTSTEEQALLFQTDPPPPAPPEALPSPESPAAVRRKALLPKPRKA